MSFKDAIMFLKDELQDEDRPVLLKTPADSEDVQKFDTMKDAIQHVVQCKKTANKEKRKCEKDVLAAKRQELSERFREKFGQDRPDIRHVVVLMLENRTFDGVQGHYMNERYQDGEIARSKWDEDGQDLYSYSNKVE